MQLDVRADHYIMRKIIIECQLSVSCFQGLQPKAVSIKVIQSPELAEILILDNTLCVNT